MNAVIIAVFVMLLLSLLRVQVVIALILGALAGGLAGGLGIDKIISEFTAGLGGSAEIALSYALLGGFAIAISRTGLPDLLVNSSIQMLSKEGEGKRKSYSKALIFFLILMISIFSQNLIPVHIAFIPVLIPPLLKLLNKLQVDRRAVASIITFGLTAPYILLPFGFGSIFHEILKDNMAKGGLTVELAAIPKAMAIPVVGMVVGLLIAVFVTYRKNRTYEDIDFDHDTNESTPYTVRSVAVAVIAIIATVVAQVMTESMIASALIGIIILLFSGSFNVREADNVITDGMKMMAFIGFVMIAASGFAQVVSATGDVEVLVNQSAEWLGNNKPLAAFVMLMIGLIITMGIGSSFSTIPIIATIFVPLCLELGFSMMSTVAIVGTAAALGDAGSPASDSTLGPTAGLNVDEQHNHIWDTVVPTFIHYNIPLLIFGWIAAVIL